MGALQSVINTLAFPRPHRAFSEAELLVRPDLVWLTTRRGQRVPAIHRAPAAPKPRAPRFTLIYSHGNAEDLGLSLPYVDHLADSLGVDVFAFEYVGYSVADGEPSERGIYDSAQAAWDYLSGPCGVPPGAIVPFGRSLGSVAAVHLAAGHARCGGCVLISPLASGVRVLSGVAASLLLKACDPFQNYAKVHRIMCPTVVIHGTADEVRARAGGRSRSVGLARAPGARLQALLSAPPAGGLRSAGARRLLARAWSVLRPEPISQPSVPPSLAHF